MIRAVKFHVSTDLSNKKKLPKNSVYVTQNFEYAKIRFLTKTQMIRYGYYRRSDLKKEKIKRILSNFNPFLKNINSSDPLILSLKGLTKLFVGELVENAKQVMFRKKDTVKWMENSIQYNHIISTNFYLNLT